MTFLYDINYAVFAVFFSLFLVEIGISLLSLIGYGKDRDRIRRYIMPIWEIDGTFAVFYLVDFEATYPNLLAAVGTMYIAPMLMAALFFILRNAFLAYSEFIGKIKNEKIFIGIYSISTLAIAFLSVSILSSGVSGIGVNLSSLQLNLSQIAFNWFNIAIFVALAIFGWVCANILLGLQRLKLANIAMLILAIALVGFAASRSASYLISSLVSAPLILLPCIALTVSTIFAYWSNSKSAKVLAIPWLFAIIYLFGIMQNGNLFGGAANFNSYTVSGIEAVYVLTTTLAGCIFLGIILAYFVYLSHAKAPRSRK